MKLKPSRLLAIGATIVFVLAAFSVTIGEVNLIALGLALLAASFAL